MGYGKDLLTAATEKAGSRYALAKLTGIAESGLSRAANGEREVPASWVLALARVAGIDPTEAMEMHDLERAEKKRLRRLSLRSAAAGVGVIWLTFASNGDGLDRAFSAARSLADSTAYASYRLALLFLRRRIQLIRTRWPERRAEDCWRALAVVPG